MNSEQTPLSSPLNVKELSPYLSVILAKRSGCTIDRLTDLIKQQIKNTLVSSNDIIQDMRAPDELAKDAEVSAFNFEVSKSPSWLDKTYSHPEIQNTEHHCIVIYGLGDFYAIYCSNSDLKELIRKEVLSSDCGGTPTPVPINRLFSCFIDDDNITMLWLSHIGGKSRFKPGSKYIGGDGLADSLDPMDDQTYSMSAVRTKFDHTEGGVKGIGLNPYKSMIWASSTSSWEQFSFQIMEVLQDLNNCAEGLETEAPISILSYPINNVVDVKEPYEFAVVDAEVFALEDDSRVAILVREIESQFSYELLKNDFTDAICIRVYFEGAPCGEVRLTYSIKDYRVKLKSEYTATGTDEKAIKRFSKIFNHTDLIKIWFESAHILVNGMMFKTELKDLPFNEFFWTDFGETAEKLKSSRSSIYREKPTQSGNVRFAPDEIGNSGTLFCWVKNNWNSLWTDKESFFELVNERPRGWLYCDDGSGEKADFIHIDEVDGEKVVTFIHAKAAKKSTRGEANNKRGVSVGAHDVVVNQAVKNLRHCDRKNLEVAIREQIDTSKVRRVWLDGELVEKDGMELFLEQIQSLPISHKKRVVVIQPHTRREVYENDKGGRSRLQLDTILLSARRACHSHGAEFYVVGTDDRNSSDSSHSS